MSRFSSHRIEIRLSYLKISFRSLEIFYLPSWIASLSYLTAVHGNRLMSASFLCKGHMAIGHEYSSSMRIAILLLMSASFLYGNVDTSFLILRRNDSARMECWSLVVANTSTLNFRKTTQSRGHGKLYLFTRFPHTSDGTSSFQIYRLTTGGEIHPNPGPATKTSEHPCKECGESVRSNQDALLCVQCNSFSHAKCLDLTKASFKSYLDDVNMDWICSLCSLPFSNGDCCFNMEFDSDREIEKELSGTTSLIESNIYGGYANDDATILEQRKDNSSGAFTMHLKINSIQSKFEELKKLNDALKAHILVISETKIDSSYPNSQFNLNGHHMYRKDRVKGGGGLIVYFSSVIQSKKLTLPRAYKTLEAVAVESRIGRTDIVLLAIYRPPRPSRKAI